MKNGTIAILIALLLPHAWADIGLGVERLCVRRRAVTDIRDLFSGNIRFLSQF